MDEDLFKIHCANKIMHTKIQEKNNNNYIKLHITYVDILLIISSFT